MMLDGAFESTGAAGKAQALTDRNDPSMIPEKASPEILLMLFLSSPLVQFKRLRLLVILDERQVRIIALPPVRAPDSEPHIKHAR
jgi:hypothetical protein